MSSKMSLLAFGFWKVGEGSQHPSQGSLDSVLSGSMVGQTRTNSTELNLNY